MPTWTWPSTQLPALPAAPAVLPAQDMSNLMDAYMDVAFHPRLPADPRIFQSEAWHYNVTPQARRWPLLMLLCCAVLRCAALCCDVM